MQNYQLLIEKIKKRLNIPKQESFLASREGTHHKVFISKRYVVRFRDDNPKFLSREGAFLKKFKHPLIPKILWMGKIDKSIAMIENRLPGKSINLVWKTLSPTNKLSIVKQLINFLKYLRTQKRKFIYSVNTGRRYKTFLNYLTTNSDKKIAKIRKFKKTEGVIRDLLLILDKTEIKKIFANNAGIALVHGDLIIHNLLTDGKNLTGILDWELALSGDPDYDLFRLFYYQECAKAYQEQGIDETFESDYMDKLIAAILKSGLIKNKKLFLRKYQFVRAIFYLNALYWATSSESPEKNINELIAQWGKKSGVKYLRT